jgi:serine/threonine protein kinase
MGDLTELQKLALAGNQLTALPESMKNCKKLGLMRISANQLSSLPEWLFTLPKLAWLAFSGNPFTRTDIDIQSVPLVPYSSFALQNILGQGASGVISKAVWNTPTDDFPDDIAVKVFKGELTSDGYPEDELQACLKVGGHASLVKSLAQVNEPGCLALVMQLIPEHYHNLGLPPDFDTCTRDTFEVGFSLSIQQISKIIKQIQSVFAHLHDNQVSHGDLYAHNTLFDQDANIIFGDFGAATMYHMLNKTQQAQVQQIERRALNYFIEDLLSVCAEEDKTSDEYQTLVERIS